MIKNPALNIAPLFKKAICECIFPGAAIAVITNYKDIKNTFFGLYGYTDYEKKKSVKLDTIYDLASLTKPLATTLAVLSLIKEKKLSLVETLPALLECSVPEDKKNISLVHLLNHSAGFAPHQPFFIHLKDIPTQQRVSWLCDNILNNPLIYYPGKKQVYSDLGFMLLGMIVEKKSHISLANYVRKKVFFPLKIDEDLIFNEKIDLSKKRYYAPTEKCSWRGKVLHGEVHDDNAWAMGGAAGHAGLFGTVKGVAKLVGFILDCIKGRAQHPSITNQDLQQAIHKLSDKGTWGLGFDTRSDQGSSSGQYLSSTSFGHLGYTGTSFWIDPERDMAIILLTNRVYPTRNNQQIKEFRPVFHDRIMELLFFSGNYTG